MTNSVGTIVNDMELKVLFATFCDESMHCQPEITTLPRWKQGAVKHYSRTDVSWDKVKLLCEHLGALKLVNISNLLIKVMCHGITPAIKFWD